MGCIHSRPSDEDVVRRFRARKRFMKQAVMHRQAFATAHYAYLYALRNTGAALRQFAEGESVKDATSSGISNAGGGHGGLLEPPPPPPPGLLSSSSLYSTSAATSAPAGANIRDEPGSTSTPDGLSPSLTSSSGQRDGSAADTWSPGSSSKRSETPPPPSPQKSSSWDFFNPFRPSSPPFQLINEQRKSSNRARASTGSFYAGEGASNPAAMAGFEEDEEDAYRRHSSAVARWEHSNREAARAGGDKDLLDMVKELDEWFLKASSSGTSVSKVLETRKGHFLAVFPEIKKSTGVGHSSHMFMSSLPWHWSKTTSYSTEDLDKVVDSDSMGSHALTLERLCAWEKKLFNEVKSGEVLRTEHQKKCTLLRHQEAKGEDSSVVDKTRAAIKRLHSLILVASQAVESTTAAIKKLRDEELYPQLVELAQGLTYMWRVVHECHAQQKQVARQFKNLDALMASREGEEATTEYHRHATVELEKELSNWYDCFCKLVASHREYVTALNGWARLSVLDASMLDEAANKENEYNSMMMQQQQEYGYPDSYTAQYTNSNSASVPANKPVTPKVLRLCEEWQKAMDRLPDKVASEAIKSLVAVVHALVVQQAEELRQKKKTERLGKRLEKKLASLQSAERKQSEAPPPAASRKSSQPENPTQEGEYNNQEYSYSYFEEESLSTDESERMTEDSSSIAAYQGVTGRDPLVDRKAEVDALRKKLEEQRVKQAKCVQDTRVLTMNSLQTGLPGVFEAMTGFSAVCGQAFQALCDAAETGE